MRISTLLLLASMTTLLACPADDDDDPTAGTATDATDPSTSMTDPATTESMTDPATTESMTDPATTESMTDPATTDATTGDTDPTTGDTDPTTGTDPDTGTETGNEANCELYCGVFLTFCQDAKGGLDGADPYTDMAACMDTCLGFETGVEGEMAGNTLACRGYHLEVATMMMGMGHCGHADADGTGVCVD